MSTICTKYKILSANWRIPRNISTVPTEVTWLRLPASKRGALLLSWRTKLCSRGTSIWLLSILTAIRKTTPALISLWGQKDTRKSPKISVAQDLKVEIWMLSPKLSNWAVKNTLKVHLAISKDQFPRSSATVWAVRRSSSKQTLSTMKVHANCSKRHSITVCKTWLSS